MHHWWWCDRIVQLWQVQVTSGYWRTCLLALSALERELRMKIEKFADKLKTGSRLIVVNLYGALSAPYRFWGARSWPRPRPGVARSRPRPGPGVNQNRKIYWLGHYGVTKGGWLGQDLDQDLESLAPPNWNPGQDLDHDLESLGQDLDHDLESLGQDLDYDLESLGQDIDQDLESISD